MPSSGSFVVAIETYYNLEALGTTKDPVDRVRWSLIEGITDGSIEGTLEPMTIIFKAYRGAGDIRYVFPNQSSSGRFSKYVDANGYMKSIVPGKSSWSFFTIGTTVMSELAQYGLVVQHLLCAHFQREGTQKRDLYPLLLVSAVEFGGMAFSAQNARASSKGALPYLEECSKQNLAFLESLTTS
jgi:hypothetical protein